MNEEIKEITHIHVDCDRELLWIFYIDNNGKRHEYVDIDEESLTDYIINLQKENKELNRVVELYSKSLYNAELTRYKEENERLKATDQANNIVINLQVKEYQKLNKIIEDIDKYIHIFKIEDIGEKTMLILNDILLIKNGLGKDVVRLNKLTELKNEVE